MSDDGDPLRGSSPPEQLLVDLEEVLPDMLVVSCVRDCRTFRGVLMDTNQGSAPYGVYPEHASPSPHSIPNKYQALLKRWTYNMQPSRGSPRRTMEAQLTTVDPVHATHIPVNIAKTSRGKHHGNKHHHHFVRRLRPRNVLCSNCKSVCTESGVAVKESEGKGGGAKKTTPPMTRKRHANQENLPASLQHLGKSPKLSYTLVPKLEKLDFPEAVLKECAEKYKEAEKRELQDGGRNSPPILERESSDGNESHKENEDELLPERKASDVGPDSGLLTGQEGVVKSPLRLMDNDVPGLSICPPSPRNSPLQQRENLSPPQGPPPVRSGMALRRKTVAIGALEDLWDESIFSLNEPVSSPPRLDPVPRLEPAPPEAAKVSVRHRSKRKSDTVIRISLRSPSPSTSLVGQRATFGDGTLSLQEQLAFEERRRRKRKHKMKRKKRRRTDPDSFPSSAIIDEETSVLRVPSEEEPSSAQPFSPSLPASPSGNGEQSQYTVIQRSTTDSIPRPQIPVVNGEDSTTTTGGGRKLLLSLKKLPASSKTEEPPPPEEEKPAEEDEAEAEMGPFAAEAEETPHVPVVKRGRASKRSKRTLAAAVRKAKAVVVEQATVVQGEEKLEATTNQSSAEIALSVMVPAEIPSDDLPAADQNDLLGSSSDAMLPPPPRKPGPSALAKGRRPVGATQSLPPPGSPTLPPLLQEEPEESSVEFCLTSDGKWMLAKGDVVWGKVNESPWWPAKILFIFREEREISTGTGGNESSKTHVAAVFRAIVRWYGLRTYASVDCDQLLPLLQNFRGRCNHKRRGPYKNAVKEAMLEAKRRAAEKSFSPMALVSPVSNGATVEEPPPVEASAQGVDLVGAGDPNAGLLQMVSDDVLGENEATAKPLDPENSSETVEEEESSTSDSESTEHSTCKTFGSTVVPIEVAQQQFMDHGNDSSLSNVDLPPTMEPSAASEKGGGLPVAQATLQTTDSRSCLPFLQEDGAADLPVVLPRTPVTAIPRRESLLSDEEPSPSTINEEALRQMLSLDGATSGKGRLSKAAHIRELQFDASTVPEENARLSHSPSAVSWDTSSTSSTSLVNLSTSSSSDLEAAVLCGRSSAEEPVPAQPSPS
ncbi:unnamed protein product [Cyprideis torosa]|uniref:Uncharacterized protein n=1 Tax=Cyprideis torosa TaxID=163714 RepID=A0A7R8ZJB2_9CRUS|nr:unnamed protein product [Cyprideis torosa]CAG0886532.1 unnamed protein product [Cyprideis torosa]